VLSVLVAVGFAFPAGLATAEIFPLGAFVCFGFTGDSMSDISDSEESESCPLTSDGSSSFSSFTCFGTSIPAASRSIRSSSSSESGDARSGPGASRTFAFSLGFVDRDWVLGWVNRLPLALRLAGGASPSMRRWSVDDCSVAIVELFRLAIAKRDGWGASCTERV